MGLKHGVEVGVQYGLNAVDIFDSMPRLEWLDLVDPWYEEGSMEKASENLSPYTGWSMYQKTSEEFASLIAYDKYDFAYIDGDHSYDAVMLDIILWHRRVRSGGIISGHDYIKTNKHGVKRAVDDYTKYHNIGVKVLGVNWYWEVK